MAVEIISQVEAQSAVLDCMPTEALVAELARRGELGKALAAANREQIADDIAERCDKVCAAAALAWSEAERDPNEVRLHNARITVDQCLRIVTHFKSAVCCLVSEHHRARGKADSAHKSTALFQAQIVDRIRLAGELLGRRLQVVPRG